VEAPVVIVKVEEPEPGAAIDAGLKLAVAPAGKPEAESDTTELKLPDIVVVIVVAPEPPAVTARLDGVEVIAKSAVAPTVKLIVAEWVLPPPEPLTTTLYVPGAAVAPTEIVKVEAPEPGAAIDAGLKLAVAPAGKPEVETETAELKLPDTVVVIVVAPEPPAVTARLDGAELIVKSAAAAPEVVAFKAKSSTTKEVFRFEFSVPTR
jgi:MinD-like ATPase involved in chromosome partitioning or flagellar assembly